MIIAASRNQGRWDPLHVEKAYPRTPVGHAYSLSPGLSHRINVTCTPCLIKGRAGTSRGELWRFTFSFSLLLGGKGSLIFSFFYLQPSEAQKLQRLGTKLPLSPIYNPYYKSTQITQQHELDVGCYSPEARTNINPMCPLFAQPSEAWHAIREIICRRLENPDSKQPIQLLRTQLRQELVVVS
jgi:hypothetical protein